MKPSSTPIDPRRINSSNLLPGFKHLVKDADYLGGTVAFIERRLSVAQLLNEMANEISIEELADMYSLPLEAIYEAIRYASNLATKETA
jgi:uncharacterized protein (DUF433 family)